jgi:hypothetical protein
MTSLYLDATYGVKVLARVPVRDTNAQQFPFCAKRLAVTKINWPTSG